MKPRYGYGLMIDTKGKRIYLKVPNHPYKTASGYVLLSRLIVEQLLNRYLKPQECVHHKDGNSYNNAPDNLKVFDSQSPHATFHNIKRILNPGLAKLRDKSWLIEQYINQEKTLDQIAKELDCCDRTVYNNLIKLNIIPRRYTLTKESIDARIKGAKSKKPRRKLI